MDNWMHGRCGGNKVRFLLRSIFSPLHSPFSLVLCCVIVCLPCHVLISPTQSGSDDGHMSMYSLCTQYRLLVGSPDQPQRASGKRFPLHCPSRDPAKWSNRIVPSAGPRPASCGQLAALHTKTSTKHRSAGLTVCAPSK